MTKSFKTGDAIRVSQLIESGDADAARAAINVQQAGELRQAANLIETSAFELAGLHPGNLIGQLIILAADIERIAQAVEADEPVAIDPDA